MSTSPLRPEDTPFGPPTKFSVWAKFADVINCAKFHLHWLSRFWAPGVRKSQSALCVGKPSYNSVRTNVLHCDSAAVTVVINWHVITAWNDSFSPMMMTVMKVVMIMMMMYSLLTFVCLFVCLFVGVFRCQWTCFVLLRSFSLYLFHWRHILFSLLREFWNMFRVSAAPGNTVNLLEFNWSSWKIAKCWWQSCD